MPLVNTPARKGMTTRSSGNAERLPEDAEHSSGDATEPMSAESLLRVAMEELRQMREERIQQQRQQEQFETALRLQDEKLQRLREHHQLSPSNNRELRGLELNENMGNDACGSLNFGQLGYS